MYIRHTRSTQWAVLSFWVFWPLVKAFNFTVGNPTQCDDLTISWTGGTAPYQLLLAPIYGSQRNITIPSSSFDNGKGSYSTQLTFKQSQKFLVTMSDATGFGTGGTTNVLQVGASLGGSCNTTDPGVFFSFELNTALQQCRPYTFSGYTGAVQPVTITGLIPSGQTFILQPPPGPTSFNWVADVANGTSIVFLMADSQGNVGGCSDVNIVGITDDSTCLSGISPSSTVTPTSTSTFIPSPSATSSTAPASSTGTAGVSVAAIAGTVIGALIFLAVIITLGLFFLRKHHDSRKHNGPSPFHRNSQRLHSEIDLNSAPPSAYSDHSRFNHSIPPEPNPFLLTPMENSSNLPSRSGSMIGSRTPYEHQSMLCDSPDPFANHLATTHSSMTAAQRKHAMGRAPAPPSRFILHTDAEDDIPPNEDGVVELPPQYSDSRKPMNHLQSSNLQNEPTTPLSPKSTYGSFYPP